MATPSKGTGAPSKPFVLDRDGTTRLWIYLLGATVVLAAFVSPWWTRGLNVDTERIYAEGEADTDFLLLFTPPGTEGVFYHYGAFQTPSVGGTHSLDASREPAVAVLGVAMVASVGLLATSLAIRMLRATGRLTARADVPVAFAIGAFGFGIGAVLFGALFLPLMGSNPGFLWGTEEPDSAERDSDGIVDATRYANVGFYAGIVGFVGLPVYAWADAAAARRREEQALAERNATADAPASRAWASA